MLLKAYCSKSVAAEGSVCTVYSQMCVLCTFKCTQCTLCVLCTLCTLCVLCTLCTLCVLCTVKCVYSLGPRPKPTPARIASSITRGEGGSGELAT